jgi:hypothetical protein
MLVLTLAALPMLLLVRTARKAKTEATHAVLD